MSLDFGGIYVETQRGFIGFVKKYVLPYKSINVVKGKGPGKSVLGYIVKDTNILGDHP